ncbi:hypothetical protein MUK72_09880 [Halococcus dombrowskii]|nr:hypothetical protein [Halococcus dombrowskii]UOO94278.1 hypothetical protein MUK72_09880 [Halococcus dombrowskii]
MEPEYSLMLQTNRTAVNPGDTVTIEVYITGWGRANRGKLSIVYSNPELISEQNPPTSEERVTSKQVYTGVQYPQNKPPSDVERQLDSIGTAIRLNDGYFMSHPEILTNPGYPPIISEVSLGDRKPPIAININVSETAAPGDYYITFTMSYGHGSLIKQDQQRVNIQVNTLPEYFRREIELAVVLGGIGAVIAIILPLASDLSGILLNIVISIGILFSIYVFDRLYTKYERY